MRRFTSSPKPVQFVTGLNYRDGAKMIKKDGYYATWGKATGGVGSGNVEVGAALLYDSDRFAKTMDDGKQALLISKPTKSLEFWISSSNSREAELNSMEKFVDYIKECKKLEGGNG